MLPVLFANADPLRAAVELDFFRAVPTASEILLEWSTLSERELSGFRIQCKRTQEPDSAYHQIAFRPAQGGSNFGADYFVLANQALYPGETYCFRLQEVRIDGTVVDLFDLCGYGLNITPTPDLGLPAQAITDTTLITGTATPTPSPTLLIITAPEGPDSPVNPAGEVPPTFTVTPFSPQPTPTSTFTPALPATATPTFTQPPQPQQALTVPDAQATQNVAQQLLIAAETAAAGVVDVAQQTPAYEQTVIPAQQTLAAAQTGVAGAQQTATATALAAGAAPATVDVIQAQQTANVANSVRAVRSADGCCH